MIHENQNSLSVLRSWTAGVFDLRNNKRLSSASKPGPRSDRSTTEPSLTRGRGAGSSFDGTAPSFHVLPPAPLISPNCHVQVPFGWLMHISLVVVSTGDHRIAESRCRKEAHVEYGLILMSPSAQAASTVQSTPRPEFISTQLWLALPVECARVHKICIRRALLPHVLPINRRSIRSVKYELV